MVDDMGGLRKKMPTTFWTYGIATFSLAGIFPLAGFWSKDEILAGTGGANLGNGTYYFALVMLLLAAFCTAAYMMRTIWYAFYNGSFKGHGHPHESGPRMAVPLIILAFMSVVAGWVNLPATFFFDIHLPSWMTLKFERYVEPVGPFFPSHATGYVHASFNGWLAALALLVGLGGLGASYLFYFKRALRPLEGLADRWALARAGKTLLENKYYLDFLYTDVIVGTIKRPIALAANWFNQHILDGVVNGAGKGAVGAGKWVYEKIDQQVVDGVVNGTGLVAEESGGELRRFQTGHVQQYAALFFAGAAVLAGVFVLVVGR
jgi:NADH-quinone oxidoreductase subunit L